jgi:aryl-alcohol dehydrogenase-like predicted oxidoreductase
MEPILSTVANCNMLIIPWVVMDYGSLGRGGPRTSRLCLGTNNFGRQLGEERAKAVISTALEMGINMVDTADVYNEGRSEEIIGRAIEGRREQVMVATKAGIVTDGGPRMVNLSAKYIERKTTESLRRLRTRYIDLFYLHRYDPDTPLDESLRAVDKLVKSGKVRFLGLSNFTVGQVEEAMEICDSRGYTRPVALQTQFSLLARDANRELIPRTAARGIGVFAYSPLWGGFLTGKYRRGEVPPGGSRGEANRMYWERVMKEGDFELIKRLEGIAEEAGITLRELALAWILQNPDITASVVGASAPEQVVENCRVFNTRLEPEIMRNLQRVLG